MTVYEPHDITEDMPYDISGYTVPTTFTLTDTAYDLTIDDIPFVMNVSNQNPYRRETAQYRKDQFDNSQEPGEQSLTGWWLRSQTSFHNGAGISFYEPGTDYQSVAHRFADSRGVDVWTIGEATLLPKVFHAYTGIKGINASAGRDGLDDVLVSGDNNGILKRLKLNGNSTITSDSTVNYVHTGTSYCQGHNGSNYPFTSVTTSGSKYYATCSGAIHRGDISTLNSDTVFARHSGGDTNAFVKYAKGFVFFGENNILNLLDTTQSDTNAHDGALPGGKQYDSRTHIDSEFVWNDVAAGTTHIYASGNSGNNGEIFKIGFDGAPTSANNGSLLPDLSSSTVTATLPDGETIKAIYYYLGYLAVGTNLGVRICQVTPDGDIVIGPLLLDSAHPINGFTQRGNYIYAATKVDSGAYTNGILIRIDLSQQFTDGTFAYAYDLEYESSLDGDSSDCTEVYNIDNRIVMVIQENSDTIKGELQVEHSTDKRSSGYLQTGKIRYGTIEPKFFRYINVQCDTGQGDSIVAYTINDNGDQASIATLTAGLSNQDVFIQTLSSAQELVSFKFVFNNLTDDQGIPVLKAYQIKALPAAKRQRLIQYPLSCYDFEMDKFNSAFGYEGRSISTVQRLESIEQTGRFVNVTDYRTGEEFQGIIEEVRFTNESSPDKNSTGFGGLLLVTVRKM
jgi:hypothetical protein